MESPLYLRQLAGAAVVLKANTRNDGQGNALINYQKFETFLRDLEHACGQIEKDITKLAGASGA
jgi:hypothetical protein